MSQKRRRRGSLSEEDRAQWAAFAAAIAPLPGRAGLPAPTPPAIPPQGAPIGPASTGLPREEAGALDATAARPGQPAHKRAALSPLAVGQAPGGVDKASWRRLAEGKLATERKLDLHGMTLDQARTTLGRFLETAQKDGVRAVEVVTGRGGLRGEGAIKRELPHWLNLPSLRPLVLAAAYPHAANPGAVRLLLRRVRP